MAKGPEERLARLLGGEEAGAFSGQVSLPADGLRLEVDGVGPIRLPMNDLRWLAPRRGSLWLVSAMTDQAPVRQGVPARGQPLMA
jgi:hypothetical protein